jgi:hypothetical protein
MKMKGGGPCTAYLEELAPGRFQLCFHMFHSILASFCSIFCKAAALGNLQNQRVRSCAPLGSGHGCFNVRKIFLRSGMRALGSLAEPT